tara:strand:+ start:49494 stop:49763 length:270 start_codon:yes stop_codon:yes gene_type:complete
MSTEVPSKSELHIAFTRTVDAIIGDTYEAWKTAPDTPDKDFFEMDRDWVATYINTHAGDLAEKVSNWIQNTPNWQQVCDAYHIPQSWVE